MGAAALFFRINKLLRRTLTLLANNFYRFKSRKYVTHITSIRLMSAQVFDVLRRNLFCILKTKTRKFRFPNIFSIWKRIRLPIYSGADLVCQRISIEIRKFNRKFHNFKLKPIKDRRKLDVLISVFFNHKVFSLEFQNNLF